MFPHAEQIVRVYRERCTLDNAMTSTETAFYLTSLPADLATPAQLDQLVRGHWGIENRVHYVRDVTYDEDRSQAYTGNGPRTLATCRNESHWVAWRLHLLSERWSYDTGQESVGRREASYAVSGFDA